MDSSYVIALGGGALIGIAASLLMLSHGRVAGISGIFALTVGGQIRARPDALAFVLGLLAAGLGAALVAPESLSAGPTTSVALTVSAGIVVGVGTQLGHGCTSGHGVCGLSRLSLRSLAATLTFMASGMVTVFVMRHLLGSIR